MEPSSRLLTERALRISYGVVLPRIAKREIRCGWGSGPLATDRSWEFYADIAKELDSSLADILAARAVDDPGRRIIREYQEEAAGDLVTLVRRMPGSVRTVVEARALGISWREIARGLPDRVYFSIMDDWKSAVATVWQRAEDAVLRLV